MRNTTTNSALSPKSASLAAYCAPALHLAYAAELLKRREQRASNDNSRPRAAR